VIVCTGTGSTGWAASVSRGRVKAARLPKPAERRLAWFVREAWPGPGLGVNALQGEVADAATVRVVSEMDAGGTIFADGLESDALAFDRGRTATIGVAPERLRLVA
jgi:hypothetical protein